MRLPVLTFTLCLQAALASAITIQLDYTYDQSTDNFFATNTTARATLERAASDLSAAINQSLNAVTTDKYTGTNGTTSVTFDWALTFENPSVAGTQVTLSTFTFPNDTLTIFVGMRPLTGSTLGQGGPGGASFSAQTQGASGSIQGELPGAVDAAEAASNLGLGRGGGPTIGTLNGDFSVPNTNYALHYGAMIGTLWFDNDTDNNGTVDNATTLANSWHFDITTGVAPGKNDFYSVALHEMLHAIGFGTSETWDGKVSGTTWLGSNAMSLNGGSGANLISADGAHLASGLQSPRLGDGVLQEVAMDPSLTTGTRKFLTQMDLAVLRDLGYAAVPEPGTAALVLAGAVLLCRRQRRGNAHRNLR